MAISKIILNNVTQMDIRDTTATSNKILSGYTAYGADGSKMVGTASSGGGSASLGTKSITTNGDYYAHTDGYDGYSMVSVNVSGGVTPTGNINITHSGQTDVTNYATATVPTASVYTEAADMGFKTVDGVFEWHTKARTVVDPNEGDVEGWIAAGDYDGATQSYRAVPANTTITPTTSAQTIGGTKFMMEGAVTVAAMPIGSVTAPNSISGTAATVSTGTNTLTLTKTISVTPNVTTAGYISSGTAGNSSVSLTASVNTRSSSDLTVSGATITAPAGYYSTSASKSVSSGSATAPASISGTSATVTTGTNTLTFSKSVSVTPSVTAGYISSGTAGNSTVSLTANVTTQAAKTVTPTTSSQTAVASGVYTTGAVTVAAIPSNYITTTDANAAATDIVSGKTAYVNGSKITGSLVTQAYYTGSSTPSSSLGSNGDIYLKVVS